ncbi:MAG: ABC-F family ATP-binding cassette domain-containing protein, partial [Clostridium celatum]|nr:ABC-F family ATP-binding cassette domain-containing protein [Clostridium celatum]
MQLIKINKLKKYYGDRLILDIDKLEISDGDKIGLVGINGCGKTTLLKVIMDKNESIKIANRVKIGYFQQDLMILNEDKSILNNILESSSENETFIRIVLSRFLFRESDVYKRVSVLSGGEKVRVALCKILLSDNNLLILDEPTNYLDIQSMEALEEALKNSNKTMIIVSHDRR